ncbi:MAG: response regulator transcription factor [Candidatus Riflebacteria bacterium]|nr:response regulator transcription factor [Candidatus Riflebacteria bacterium]
MTRKNKILIVDDHDGFRRTLRIFLEWQKLDLWVLEANSERAGVQKALKEQPEIVLLELRLPKMNGIKASKLVKKVSPNSKIIVVSVFDTENFQKRFLGEHISDFIGKNEFDFRLFRVLRKHLKN